MNIPRTNHKHLNINLKTATSVPAKNSNEAAVLKRVDTLRSEGTSISEGVTDKFQTGDKGARGWADQLSAKGSFGQTGYQEGTIGFRGKRSQNDAVLVEGVKFDGNEVESLKVEARHPTEGGSIANKAGNFLHKLGAHGVAELVHKLDNGPRDQFISHRKGEAIEEALIRHDGSISYSTNNPDAFLLMS